jgi:hypothetical protein
MSNEMEGKVWNGRKGVWETRRKPTHSGQKGCEAKLLRSTNCA